MPSGQTRSRLFEFDPLLSSTRFRLVSIALLLSTGHIFFGLLWTYVYPQSYEDMHARLAVSAIAIPLAFLTPDALRRSITLRWLVVIIICIVGPFFLTTMHLMNHGSAMWLSAACVGILATFQVLDWRVASAGSILSLALAESFRIIFTSAQKSAPEDWIAIAFSLTCGILIGISAANERTARLKATLQAMGVMAHELRTPLASLALFAEAIRDHPGLQKIASGMDALNRSMNHQIDSQIYNAQLLDPPAGTDLISARALCQNALDTYPFKRSTDRLRTRLSTETDFNFYGTPRLFNQAIQNIIKNAMHAIMKRKNSLEDGDIHIQISCAGKTGLIRIEDRGTGVHPALQRSAFEPFTSTQNNFSSGLGLSFCRAIVEVNGGRIWITNNKGTPGASVMITLPATNHKPPPPASRPAPLRT